MPRIVTIVSKVTVWLDDDDLYEKCEGDTEWCWLSAQEYTRDGCHSIESVSSLPVEEPKGD